MHLRTRVVIAAAAALGLLAASGTAAQAAKPSSSYQPPVVQWVQPVVNADTVSGTAVVHAHYTCWGGNAHTHLFIAVKQGPQINATDHTSSQFADTFYSTNYNADGPGLSLNCNGRQQNGIFVLEPDPYWANAEDNPPPLHAGRAFVQFCLFDSTNSGADGDLTGFAFDYSMRKVALD